MAMPPPSNAPPDSAPRPTWSRRFAAWRAMSLRELWWELLDAWDDHRRLRRVVYGIALGAALVGIASVWVYPWWRERSTVRIAREWLETGRLDSAAAEVRRALISHPTLPEVWRLAAELERRAGRHDLAADRSARASDLAPGDAAVALEWAIDALRADRPEFARRAIARLTPESRDASAPAQRLLGELARRTGATDAAMSHYLAARRLAGPGPLDEVPLGRLLLLSADAAEKKRGRELLARFAADPEWGAVALRALLGDALTNGTPAERLRLADALREHPRCAVEDMPVCLRQLAAGAPERFAEVLTRLEQTRAREPDLALGLVGWLNQIDRPRDALRWLATLEPAVAASPALRVAWAESFRLAADWSGLGAHTELGDWGEEYEFLRQAYAVEAARRRGNETRRAQLWQFLRAKLAANGVHAHYAAGALYLWGMTGEAVELAEGASTDPRVAVPALGFLARHYQTQRDALGQYRAFRRLHALRPDDVEIANNLAYFAALTGENPGQAETLARKNLAAAPGVPARAATYAFVLALQGRAAEALAVLEPHRARLGDDPGLALAYGLALARERRRAEARVVLAPLLDRAQTGREAELIRAVLE